MRDLGFVESTLGRQKESYLLKAERSGDLGVSILVVLLT